MKIKFVFFLLSIIGLISCASRKLESPPYKQYVKFESFWMTGEMAVLLSPNKIIIYKRGSWYEKTIKKHLRKKDWHTIKNVVEKVNLDSMAYFAAPSNERGTDGASYDLFKIYINDSLYSSQYYDGGNPHKNLEKLERTVFNIYKDYDKVSWDELNEQKKNRHEVFTIVETQPKFQNGKDAFNKFVKKEMEYPSLARKMDIEGKVFVQFVVKKNGSISNIKVIKGIGADCEEEAIRIMESSPKWEPGKQRGKPVNVRMVLPITFKY